MELVGVYHAGYTQGSALNVVVGIDQFRDFIRKKRRVLHGLTEGMPGAPRDADRARVSEALAGGTLPLFEFGGFVVRAEVGDADGALLYHVYGRQFPLDNRRVAVLEDLPKRRTLRRAGAVVGARSKRLGRMAPARAGS